MASAIGTALICTNLSFMVDKAMDNGNRIVKYIADKAVDKAVDKVMDKPMDKLMAMVVVNIEGDISKLQTTLYMIQAIVQVAEVAEEKQIGKKGKPVVFIQNWLRDLVDIGYEARDVLDDFITFSSCVITAEESSNPVNFISSFIMKYVGGSSSDTSNIPLAILNRLAKDIRSVTERFDVEIKESEKFNTLNTVDPKSLKSVLELGSESVRVDRRPEVGPFINKQRDALLLGREEVKEGIMEKLLNPSDDNRVHVVAIWGMGGIGKTTLAQSIYNDERVVKEVPRSWLCVGESKFSVEKVIKEILHKQETIGIGELQEKLVKKFEGNRFLIVLDDVWDVDGSEWDLLFNPLTNVGKGGLIIITTRERLVCPAINIQTAYNLEPLSEKDSWSIFESCAYVNGKADSTPDLKRIGEEIVKKLDGLPLALKVVGHSLLNKDYSTWTKFLDSKFSEDDEVTSALRWSYNHLPRHLKTCFTYCALFPKDHEFDQKVLVEMWMAQDLLIQKEEQKRRPEDVGAQYFEELVNASLLQCVDGKHVMHDLIHDLAVLVSNGEFASANSSLTNDQMEEVRHVTITPGDYWKIPRLCKIEKLLTLYTISSDKTYIKRPVDLDGVFKQMKSIRVMVLSSYGIHEIPGCISELTHLRYLDVSETNVTRLPDSLCHLYNLQMLAAPLYAVLPTDIVNMVNLRYVRGNLSTCKGVGKLTSLQELSSIHVSEGDNIRELGDMQRLRGKLVIEGLENVTISEDAADALMVRQTLMDQLELVFDAESTISEEILDALSCPPNLTYLTISGYTGLEPPSWMVDGKHKFDKLQTLMLNCPKLESLPPLGELTSLKHLNLRNVRVKRLGHEFYGKFTDGKVFFQSLEWLSFGNMREWEEWDDIIIENSSVLFYPRLTELEIKHCPKLVLVLPVMKAANFMTRLSRLKISYCDGLKRLQLDALESLEHLDISYCNSLVQITSAICLATTIEVLKISQCEHLETMDFKELPSLKLLHVSCCKKLISIPRLVGIEFLWLLECHSLRSLNINIRKLNSLRVLDINGCPVLELTIEEGSSSSSSGNSVEVPIIFCTDNEQIRTKLRHHGFVVLKSLPQIITPNNSKIQPQSDDDDQDKEEDKEKEMHGDPDYAKDDQDDDHSDDDLFATKIMASAIGTDMVSTILQPMAAKARDIIKDKAMAMVVDEDIDMDNIEREISNLQTTLGMIEGMVPLAEEKQIDDDDIQNWLRDLVDIAYEARDVLDDIITFSSCVIAAGKASNPVNFISSFMLSYFGGLSNDTSKLPHAILNRLEKNIRSFRERFDETFASLKSMVGSESVRVDRRPEVGPFLNKQEDNLFLGREKVKEEIMEKLQNPSDDHRVHVVAIWGMGGIGKTTLAQSIYNDKRVKEVPRTWFCVGENKFNAEKVIKEIVNDQNTIGIGKLQEKLVKKFRGNRFLIVLDDVLDVEGSEWDLLFNSLTEVGKGGLIIITRRERELCAAITIQTAYNLEPLSEEDSWSIFKSCAYVNGKSDSTPGLEGIGKDIVKKLNGLPLALKVVGRSLLNKDYSTWMLRKEDDVMSALIWSYNHLPSHIKMCFTYCSLFPKGHVLDKKVLVEMWMAHDLIQKEDVGAQYFTELVNASLLQCVNGKYVIHDMIHDLALFVSNEEFAAANGLLSTDQMERVRHISIRPGGYSVILSLRKIEKLLTLYTICSDEYINWFDDSVLYDVFKQLKSIRVLVLSSEWIYEIPDCISELKHLRYLDVSKTRVKSLPDSLCHLYNLQMLAAPCDAELPRDIVNISSLRYVRAHLSTCKGVGKLTSLQELSSISVCRGDSIRELGYMQQLRGKLTIKGLENVTSSEDDAGAWMDKQTLMDELELVFNQDLQKSTISAQVLDALGCPPNLTYLRIAGYNGLKPPSWMVGGKYKFDKLQTLELYDCPKLKFVPPLGELTCLKHLSLCKVGVKRLGDEFYGKFTDGKVFFPSLESLEFLYMNEWEEWNDIIIKNSNVSFFPRLTRLEVRYCSKLVSVLPVVKNRTSKRKREDKHRIINASNFMTSLSSLKIWNCEGLKRLQISHYEYLKKMDFERLSSVKNLDIRSCDKLISIPCLLGIKFLYLTDCKSLTTLCINDRGLDSLEYLLVSGCPVLELTLKEESSSSSGAIRLEICTDKKQIFTKLFQGILAEFEKFDETEANKSCKLRSLKSLCISRCKDLMSLPEHFYKLRSLSSLKIENFPKLQSLPPDFDKLSFLKRLEIISCPKLQSLPSDFDKLSSLNSLKIVDCPQLQSLPVRGLPNDMKSLELLNCPLLYERCKDESGFDWHKIMHIPKLTIFGDHKVHRYGGDR